MGCRERVSLFHVQLAGRQRAANDVAIADIHDEDQFNRMFPGSNVIAQCAGHVPNPCALDPQIGSILRTCQTRPQMFQLLTTIFGSFA
jgi:hypothetical protein